MLAPWVTLFDFRGIFTSYIKENSISYRDKNSDFAILIPIFNDVRYLTNINFLKKYGRKVILCTTNLETEKLLVHAKKKLLNKINLLKKEYNDWFFLVTNRRYSTKYREFGKVIDLRYFKNQIKKFIEKHKEQSPLSF